MVSFSVALVVSLLASLAILRLAYLAGGLGWDVAGALAPLGTRAIVETDLARLVQRIVRETRAGDPILVMSNGAFGGIHDLLVAALAASRPTERPC